jgi:peptidoglycan/xylan/chitin deacetylase (PgdA/CDA1 family)
MRRFLKTLAVAATSYLSFGSVSAAGPPISFRLDDVQCGWQQTNAMAVIDAFIRHDVPLTIGLITAPPLNFPGNYDCYQSDIKQRMAVQPNTTQYKLELSSHSVRHIPLTTMNATMQNIELVNSKQHIDALFGTNITLFLPPQNLWDPLVTIPLMAAAGYTTISGQCSTGETNAAAPDDMCTVNTYPTISKPFFESIDGIIHAPIGVSIADFYTGILLTPAKLMGPETVCTTNTQEQTCTINSQVTNMARFDTANTAGWSVIMMHPQNFGGDGVTANLTAVNEFYDAFLPMVKAAYSIYTVSDMVKAASGGVIPAVTTITPMSSTASSVASSSTASTTITSSTGVAASSSGTSTGPTATSSTATVVIVSSTGPAKTASSSSSSSTGVAHASGSSSQYLSSMASTATAMIAAVSATFIAVVVL